MRRSCSTIFFTLQLSASTRRQPGSAASRRSVATKRNAGISMWTHLFSWGISSLISLVSGTPSALLATASTCTCRKQTNLRRRSPGRRKIHESQRTKRLFSKPLKFRDYLRRHFSDYRQSRELPTYSRLSLLQVIVTQIVTWESDCDVGEK